MRLMLVIMMMGEWMNEWMDRWMNEPMSRTKFKEGTHSPVFDWRSDIIYIYMFVCIEYLIIEMAAVHNDVVQSQCSTINTHTVLVLHVSKAPSKKKCINKKIIRQWNRQEMTLFSMICFFYGCPYVCVFLFYFISLHSFGFAGQKIYI